MSSPVRASRWLTAVVAFAAVYWTAANYPTPARLLSDHGGGYQLAAALEILAGRQPVLDFDETYGPLTFYTSAAGQWLTGKRVIGELMLILAAFACGYALLFRLMLRVGASVAVAVGLTGAAIVAQPAGFRYYLLLWPLVVLMAGARYAEAPGGRRLAELGLAVTVAGLFRPDLGVYGFMAASVLVWASSPAKTRQLFLLTVSVLAWALPWLAWLAWNGRLDDYLVISSLQATEEAIGRAKPAPWPDWTTGLLTANNAKAFLFRLPLLMLGLAAVMLAVRWRKTGGADKPLLLATGAMALLNTLQASHIVDWIHVRDTLPVRFVLLAWVLSGSGGPAMALRAGIRRRIPAALALGLASSAALGAIAEDRERTPGPVPLAAKLREHARTRDALLQGVRERGESFRAELYEYVRDHCRPDETVFAVLECPQLNYFADRRFASRQMAIFPGYFASVRDQQRMMREIRQGPTAFVVIDHLEMMDYPEGAMARFAPEVLRFLQDEFVQVKQIGYCRVLRPRWIPGVPQAAPTR